MLHYHMIDSLSQHPTASPLYRRISLASPHYDHPSVYYLQVRFPELSRLIQDQSLSRIYPPLATTYHTLAFNNQF